MPSPGGSADVNINVELISLSSVSVAMIFTPKLPSNDSPSIFPSLPQHFQQYIMKVSSIIVAVITAMAAPAATAPTDASLEVTDVATFNETQNDPGDDLPLVWCRMARPKWTNNYSVVVRKVPKEDIPHQCHLLWQGLKRHKWICTVSKPHCGHIEIIKGEPAIHWKFTTQSLCNPGAIESAYWEATHNKYGAMDSSACGER